MASMTLKGFVLELANGTTRDFDRVVTVQTDPSGGLMITQMDGASTFNTIFAAGKWVEMRQVSKPIEFIIPNAKAN